MEMSRRNDVQTTLNAKIKEVPDAATHGAQATKQMQNVIEEVFGRIRSLVADQMQLYSESFFLLPMLRRLEGSMAKMEMPESDKKRYQAIKAMLVEEERKRTGL